MGIFGGRQTKAAKSLSQYMRLAGGSQFFVLTGDRDDAEVEEMLGYARTSAPEVWATGGPEAVQRSIEDGEKELRRYLKQHKNSYARSTTVTPAEAEALFRTRSEAALSDWLKPNPEMS